MSLIKEILEGYKKYIFEDEEADMKEMKNRAFICAKCPHKTRKKVLNLLKDNTLENIKGSVCNVCDCLLSAKVRSKDTKCPKDKW